MVRTYGSVRGAGGVIPRAYSTLIAVGTPSNGRPYRDLHPQNGENIRVPAVATTACPRSAGLSSLTAGQSPIPERSSCFR